MFCTGLLGNGNWSSVLVYWHGHGHRNAVVGDERYSDPRYVATIRTKLGFDGLALHASTLELRIDGRALALAAPLPESWAPFCGAFGVAAAPPLRALCAR